MKSFRLSTLRITVPILAGLYFTILFKTFLIHPNPILDKEMVELTEKANSINTNRYKDRDCFQLPNYYTSIASRDALSKTKKRPSPCELESKTQYQPNKVIATYELNKKQKAEQINTMRVETSSINNLTRVVNNDKTLKPYNLMRETETINLLINDELRIETLENINRKVHRLFCQYNAEEFK